MKYVLIAISSGLFCLLLGYLKGYCKGYDDAKEDYTKLYEKIRAIEKEAYDAKIKMYKE